MDKNELLELEGVFEETLESHNGNKGDDDNEG